MTEAQQIAYWRKYAKQNTKMERLAYYIMLHAIQESLLPVVASLQNNGVQRTIDDLDGIYTRNLIKAAYEKLYYQVGVKHKAWTDADIKTRFPGKKDGNRERGIAPPLIDQRIKPTFELGFFNAKWLARLKQIATGLDVGARVVSVNETLKKRIKASLIQSQQEFVSIKKIVARLRKDISDPYVRSRAEVIARTEVTHIANLAAEESAVETGLDLVKVWIRTYDLKTRDSHVNAPRNPIKANEKFKVGGKEMDKPGDPAGGLEETINCRCVVSYLPADDHDDLLDDSGDFQREEDIRATTILGRSPKRVVV